MWGHSKRNQELERKVEAIARCNALLQREITYVVEHPQLLTNPGDRFDLVAGMTNLQVRYALTDRGVEDHSIDAILGKGPA